MEVSIITAVLAIVLDPKVDAFVLGILDSIYVAVKNKCIARKKFRLQGGTLSAVKIVNQFHLYDGTTVTAYLQSNEVSIEVKQRITGLFTKLYTKAGRSHQINVHLGVGANNKWMQTYLGPERNFFNTILPSSHDSGALAFDYSKQLGSSTLASLGKISLFRSYLTASAQTTSQTLTQQLNYGIRVLDFRVSYYPSSQEYYLSHTFCSTYTLTAAVAEVSEFLQQNSGEIVLIRVKKDFENDYFVEPNGHYAVGQILVNGFGAQNIFPCNGQATISPLVSFSYLTGINQRVILAYDNYPVSDPNNNDQYIWNRNTMMQEPWPDTSSASQNTLDIINQLQVVMLPNAQITEAAFVLTPQTKDVVQSILLKNTRFARNPIDLAKLEAVELLHLLNNSVYFTLLSTKSNFVTSDFAVESGLVEAVFRLNAIVQ